MAIGIEVDVARIGAPDLPERVVVEPVIGQPQVEVQSQELGVILRRAAVEDPSVPLS